MDRNRLESMLAATPLALEKRDHAYHASAEHPLTIFAGTPSGEPMRFTRVAAVRLDPELVAAELVGLTRDEAFTIVPIESIFALERQQENERDKRRTGFF